jgi:hypothetical protein
MCKGTHEGRRGRSSYGQRREGREFGAWERDALSFGSKRKTSRKKNTGRKRKVVRETTIGKYWRHCCTRLA